MHEITKPSKHYYVAPIKLPCKSYKLQTLVLAIDFYLAQNTPTDIIVCSILLFESGRTELNNIGVLILGY